MVRNPEILPLMKSAGLDFARVDMEHTALTIERIADMAFVARANGIPSLLFSGTLILPRDLTSRFDIGDRLVVIGEHLRQSLIREVGIETERVSVVGKRLDG